MKKAIRRIIRAALIFILSLSACPAIVSPFSRGRNGYFARAEILKKNEINLTINVNGKTFCYYYPEIDFSEGRYYLKNAEEVAEDIYFSSLDFPVNASYVLHSEREQPFEFKEEKVGLGVDKQALLTSIDKVLNSGGGVINVDKFVPVKPEITLPELKKQLLKRGEFSTGYSASAATRKSNILLACKLLNGTETGIGEEFSFNEIVGDRTEERGFFSAKVIENGRFTEGVGGGVCQVSSTVYNCALLSGMTVTERHRHSLAVSYVEPSFDAMVSFSYADLRFLNDSGSPVLIVADANGERLRIRIYGEENCYRYKRISLVNELIDPLPEEIVYTSELFPGETKQMVYPKKGIRSAGVIEKYLNEKLIERKLLVTDEYSPLRGITLVGKNA